MFKGFEEIERYVLDRGTRKRIALAAAHDEVSLGAVVDARRKGVVEATLVGDRAAVLSLLATLGEDPGEYEIVDAASGGDASLRAMELVRDGAADIEMKGNLPSADFLLPIMNPFDGLVELGESMCEVTAFCYPDQDRMMFATDCALTVAPSLDEKANLIVKAVELARAFGFDEVNVAAISPLERVNPQIPATRDADELARRTWPEGVFVAGPFALDNALDEEAARHKGIDSPVAGRADVLLMPDLCTGNVFHKCLHYFGHVSSAGVVCGTKKPVVFTSRSDSAEAKYHSILAAILQSMAIKDV